MNKIFKLILNKLIIIKNSIIKLENPKNAEIIVFDRLNSHFITPLFSDRNFFILDVPGKRRKVEKIFLSLSIIKIMILEILKKNISVCYWVALIKVVKPKIVITFTDNHFDFYQMAKIFSNKIEFMAVQNAYRDESYLPSKKAKKIFIPNYFCFSQQTVDHYEKIGATVGKFYKIGSLRQYHADKAFEKVEKKNKEYDVCLISETLPSDDDPVRNERLESLEIIASHVLRLTNEKKLKTIILFKRDPLTKRGRIEKDFYRKLWGENHPIIMIDKEENYKNYHYAYKSKLVIGNRSTLLLEALAHGEKILFCNYKQEYYLKKNRNKVFDNLVELNSLFDVDKFNVDSFFSVFQKDYETFKNKALNLLNMDEKLFQNQISKFKNYMLEYDSNNSTFTKVKKQINTWLN